jgi:predicted nucleic acid-binding protein
MNVADLRGSFFLDTNVFVYSFDQRSAQKQATAQCLIREALRAQLGIISTQVVQEFLSTALRKFAHPLSVSESREYLKTVLIPLCRHYPSADFYDRALLLQEETGFSFYDALIVTAAVESRCSTLLSEDLQHGRTVRSVLILNPFLGS